MDSNSACNGETIKEDTVNLGSPFSVHYSILNRIEDWQYGFFYYVVKLRWSQSERQRIVIEGVGSCNSREDQFREMNAFSTASLVLRTAKLRALEDILHTGRSIESVIVNEEISSIKKLNRKGGEIGVTKSQLKEIHSIAKELDMKPDVARELLKLMFNKDHSTKLTRKEASALIEDLLILQRPI
ncbi:hypothetical protein [Alkalihalophilus marmarensis]|uniref:hypothetical protein n=1 Tax=Alkalihalophilus marmarensis TaxID=521377 RepID=UPI002E1B404E|nr:hypothetical protein [Alkalihalophilus marmarensis]